MGLCKGSSSGPDAGEPRTIGPFLGYIMMINLCLGTGFLSVPFAFFYAGYLAAIPTLLFVAFLSWLNCSWLLEIMARAQAMESLKKNPSDSDDEDLLLGAKKILSSSNPESQPPNFQITMERKFEMVELCEIFGNRWLKYAYLILFAIICFVGMWAFSTVAGSALASNIPYNFAGMQVCNDTAFHHQLLPVHHHGCLRSYYFSLFLFGVIVVTLSLLHLKELSIIQLFMGLLRFLTVTLIVLYSIVLAAQGGDDCPIRSTSPSYNGSASIIDYFNVSNATEILPYKDMVVKFDPRGWLTVITVSCYSLIVHFGVASLTHPVKNKKYLRSMVLGMFATALLCYMSLGVVAPLWFKASVQETVTLNFLPIVKPGNDLGLRILAYYLIFFPTLDVISAYPLVVHCFVNNVYLIITGQDTSEEGRWKCDWLLRLALRLIGSVTPLLAAMGMANLIYVITYGGLSGFIVCYFFPGVLQLTSIRACKKTFSPASPTPSDDYGCTSDEDETTPFVRKIETRRRSSGNQSYMTPYSIPVLSHPLFVAFMVGIVVAIFVLIVASLFVHPTPMTCEQD